ncbi:MAG: glycosyltransferase family 4 protein [Bacteroides sp.]|nr:glycosyltransferase family 4 protein [Bacteroides sp.]
MTIGLNLISVADTKGRGTTTFLKNIIAGLHHFSIKDCSFVIYKQKHIPEDFFNFPKDFKIEWVNVPSLGNGIKRMIFEQTLFYLYLKKSDVLFSHCTSLPLFAKSRKIFTLHDVYYKEFAKRYSKLKTLALDITTKMFLKSSDTVITVSDYSKKSILKHYRVPEEKIKVVYNFLSDRKIVANRDTLSLDKEFINKSFLYVGSIQPGKNIKGMADGFLKFSHDHPDYNLIIVGKLTYQGDRIIAELPKNKKIIYLGHQSDEVVRYLQSECFATVLLSFCEGFGIPPLEGFKFQKPTLTSDCTSLPEITGGAGPKIDPYDINAIANGFEAVVKNYDFYKNNTGHQLAKFQMKSETQKFLEILDADYEEKKLV